MPTLRFTARTVASLKPVGGRQTDFWDVSLSGFGLRVSPTRAVWTLYYRHKGRKRRYTIGRYPDLPLATARRLAKEALHRIGLGADPSAEKQADRATHGDTVQALYDVYKGKASRKKSWSEERRVLERDVLPTWGPQLVKEVTRRDVRALIEKKAETAPVMANRLLSHVSHLLNYALEHEWIDANPAARLPKPGEETSRDRVLSRDELRQLWTALHETMPAKDQTPESGDEPHPNRLTPVMNDAFMAMLLTAQRMGEVCRMRWADVDVAKGWWTVPASDAKNGAEHRVPLTAPVLAMVKARRKAADERKAAKGPVVEPVYVFANRKGTRSIMARAKKAASFLSAGLPFAFRAHDLRRTAATGMAAAGVSRDAIAHVLNHRSVTKSTVTAIYDRYDRDKEKAAALRTWARVVDRIVTPERGQPRRVVSFAR